MSLNSTPSAERIRIGFFGLRNAGKSSLLNRITNQEMSLVSEIKGTTTDPVEKSMELLPLGPVTLIDTPGFDDEGELGSLRVRRTMKILSGCDIAVLVSEAGRELTGPEKQIIDMFREKGIPHIVVRNKNDLYDGKKGEISVSAKSGEGIEELKETLGKLAPKRVKETRFVGDFISPGDYVILVIPIDSSAPKGRLILPQQQALRDILDSGAFGIVTGVDGLGGVIESLSVKPRLVITDSQVFGKVKNIVPDDILLTSFSILMARYKGFLDTALEGAGFVEKLEDGSKVLICEGCTHHRQCEDIGTVKIPGWLGEYTEKKLEFSFTSGHFFPENPEEYDFIIHCGACMLHDNELEERMKKAKDRNVPITNYGTLIAYLNGILDRSTEVLREKKS